MKRIPGIHMGGLLNDIFLGFVIYAGLNWVGQDGWIPHLEPM